MKQWVDFNKVYPQKKLAPFEKYTSFEDLKNKPKSYFDRYSSISLKKNSEEIDLTKEYFANKYSNAFKEINMDRHVARDKVSFISQLCKKQTIEKEEKVKRTLERRGFYMDTLMEERQLMGAEKYDRIRGKEELNMSKKQIENVTE